MIASAWVFRWLRATKPCCGQKTKSTAWIPMVPSDDISLPFKFKRKQFPICLIFAMAINKAQGQTIPNVVIYLQSLFSHMESFMSRYQVCMKTNRKNSGQIKEKDQQGRAQKILCIKTSCHGDVVSKQSTITYFLSVFHISLCDKNICFRFSLKFKQCRDGESFVVGCQMILSSPQRIRRHMTFIM